MAIIYRESIIQLETVEEYPVHPDKYPTITHARMAFVKAEISRPYDQREGWITIWLAKGYLCSLGFFHEAPGFPGVEVNLQEADMMAIAQIPCEADSMMIQFTKIVLQYLIDTGYVSGTVVDLIVDLPISSTTTTTTNTTTTTTITV
ncbi:MAG: hypothetical protein DRJ03_01275 [Chloroflexi bacterium]|nr:MAG: hypothetical protein DRJ03_01275 [Chloroflexota bacterium]